MLVLIISACLTQVVEKCDASPQFPSFPANNQNSKFPNFPPRFSVAGSQPSNLPINQFSDSQSVNPSSLALTNLTDKQKLGLLQRNSLRNQGLAVKSLQTPFSDSDTQQHDFSNPEIHQFDGQLQLAQSLQFVDPSQQLLQQRPVEQFPPQQFSQIHSEIQQTPAPNFDQTQKARFPPKQQFLSQPQPPQPSQSHPEQFLNQLSPEQKEKFLAQFDQLTLEQQIYAYNKFISTPPEIQKFAINQFLSLDGQVLAVALQAEIKREPQLAQFPLGQQQRQQDPHQQQPLPSQPSNTDQLALRQQQETLQQIIDLQNSINFPNRNGK